MPRPRSNCHVQTICHSNVGLLWVVLIGAAIFGFLGVGWRVGAPQLLMDFSLNVVVPESADDYAFGNASVLQFFSNQSYTLHLAADTSITGKNIAVSLNASAPFSTNITINNSLPAEGIEGGTVMVQSGGDYFFFDEGFTLSVVANLTSAPQLALRYNSRFGNISFPDVDLHSGFELAGLTWGYYNASTQNITLLESTSDSGNISTTISALGTFIPLTRYRVSEDMTDDSGNGDDATGADEATGGIGFPEMFLQVILGIGLVVLVIFAVINADVIKAWAYQHVVPDKGTHRLSLEDVFENENRYKVLQAVSQRPGIHFNELRRHTDLAQGQLSWHLDVLQQYGIIRKEEVGQYVVYYPAIGEGESYSPPKKWEKSKMTLKVLDIIEAQPGITASEIARAVNLKRNSVKYHIDKLVRQGLVRGKKAGRTKQLFPTSGL